MPSNGVRHTLIIIHCTINRKVFKDNKLHALLLYMAGGLFLIIYNFFLLDNKNVVAGYRYFWNYDISHLGFFIYSKNWKR